MAQFLKAIIRFFIFIFSAAFMWLVVSYVVYRVPENNEYRVFDGEMDYKFVELGLTNRQFFEELHENRVARLRGSPILFVSASDHKKLWTPNPHDMRMLHFTYKVKLKARPLLFGGFGLAEVIAIERIAKNPSIRK